MALTATNIILVITATTTALIAGLFYAWVCSVIPGLSRLSDIGYLEAMQSMNRAILNPMFFLSFIGTVILLPLSTYLHYSQNVSMRFWFLLAASVVYIIGVFGVTVAGNVPLNEVLDAFNVHGASAQAISLQREKFEGPWNKLHMIRTVASIFVVIFVIIGCLSPQPENLSRQ